MKNKVVVITGASAGIGAALAKEVGARGGRPVLIARRAPQLHEAAAACGSLALAIVGDVTSRADVQRACDTAIKHFGRIDVWVNNAGRGITRPVSQLTDEDVDQMVSANLKSALYGMQVPLPHFQAQGSGHIINVSSMLGRLPMAHMRSAYAAMKSALNTLTACLRQEMREAYPNIMVSTVSPGVVATEFGLNAVGGGPDSRQLPMAQPVEEVAQVIADLIGNPKADVYTRPGAQQMVAAYYSAADMGQAETQPPFAPMPRP